MMNTSPAQIPLLELDLLRTLVAIADCGNFTTAASAVHRTPSAVSMQVRRVEELVGKPVFSRDSRSVRVTAEGEIIIEHGRRVLNLNRELISRFIEPDVAGHLKLGLPNLAERSMPDMLRQFGQAYCCVTVDVRIDESESLTRRVRDGELELALVICNPEHQLDSDTELIFREKLVWAGVRHGVAFESDPLPISIWEEGCSWRAMAIESLEQIGREYRVAFMSAHTAGQRAAILADLAVAPLPESSCTGDLIKLTAEQGLPELRDYGFAIVMGSDPSEPAKAAGEYFKTAFGQ